jgi:hypothetical protein
MVAFMSMSFAHRRIMLAAAGSDRMIRLANRGQPMAAAGMPNPRRYKSFALNRLSDRY